MESKSKILSVITEMLLLLDYSKEEYWASFFKHQQKKLDQDYDINLIADEILKSFSGGMGSFNDLVLHKDGVPLIEENNKLDELKNDLFELCDSIKS